MVAIAVLCLAYVVIYSGFILAFSRGFSKIELAPKPTLAPKTTFSIVIPFRNEAQNLPVLLASITHLEYALDLFELIFIDDDSTDESVSVINKWRMQNGLFQTTLLENVRISGSPKKDAISRAIPIVRNEWILTTDADCKLPVFWLSAFNQLCQNQPVDMIAAPVVYRKTSSFLGYFQQLDFLSLQGVTLGSFGLQKAFMCNGANFAYTKSFFNAIGGFAGNEGIASGDDVFLLQKAVAQHPEKVAYLKSEAAIVTTLASKTWGELIHQRIRWAAKSSAYKNDFATDVALVVLLANLSLLVIFALVVSGLLNGWWLCVAFVIKLIPDWLLLGQTSRFLRNKAVFPVVASMVYPFFSVLVACFAIMGSYNWKGRKFKI